MSSLSWEDSVGAAIQGASGFVFVLGPPGPVDRGQTFELQQVVDLEYYLDASRALIPVLIGNPELPGFLKTRHSLILNDSQASYEDAADKIAAALQNPASTVDEKKIQLGREARRQALESFREYSKVLGEEDIKRAGIRAVE
jgi:hypothetical protein